MAASKNYGESVQLKVAEASSRDVGRGIARVDPEVMEKLGIDDSGEIVGLKGKRRQTTKNGSQHRRTGGVSAHAYDHIGLKVGQHASRRKDCEWEVRESLHARDDVHIF